MSTFSLSVEDALVGRVCHNYMAYHLNNVVSLLYIYPRCKLRGFFFKYFFQAYERSWHYHTLPNLCESTKSVLLGLRATSHTSPRAETMKLWEPRRKCPKAILTHLQNHVVWSRILKCNWKSYVTKPSTKYYKLQWISIHAGPHTQ